MKGYILNIDNCYFTIETLHILLLLQADVESMIIEEFGRCLGQIIEMANKAGAASNVTGDSKQASKAITADS